MTALEPTSPTQTEPPAFAPASLPPPPNLFIPLATPDFAEMCLPAGTRVHRGQSLLKDGPATTLQVPLASAAGTILGITETERMGRGRATAVEIEVDLGASGEPEPIHPANPPADLAALIDSLCRLGIQADRHTSPNLLSQLRHAAHRPIDTVVCSLLDPAGESELHATLLRGFGDAVVAGINVLATVTGAERVWCAADTRVTAASVAVRKAGLATRIRVIEIANDYPQADPTLLLYALLGRRLKPDRLPTDVGVLFVDGLAAAAIGRCVTSGRPMLEVPVEVRESDRSACSVRTVAVGTPLRYVLHQLWLRPQRLTLRAGAALRDVRVSPDAVFDGVAEVSVEVGPVSPAINPDPCIRCGWCVDSCPVRIHPAGLLEAAQDNDLATGKWFGLGACIECGVCSYVCPSRLPLLTAIRGLRAKAGFPPHRQET